ncbi:hypothetical protein MFLAVUS_006920 [Mucor flavus]|uniref:Uncharacterized protein n=1 Tax=Mucor flavus TaxID=439312 RepID=A0ABP9Z2V6_9FUNG
MEYLRFRKQENEVLLQTFHHLPHLSQLISTVVGRNWQPLARRAYESCYDEDDVYMDQDVFSDDDFVQDLLPTDYIYFTLPAHDESILPSVMEALNLCSIVLLK